MNKFDTENFNSADNCLNEDFGHNRLALNRNVRNFERYIFV